MYIIIVNTVSGNGQGAKILEQIQSESLYSKVTCRTFMTQYKGHAEILTKSAIKMYGEKITAFIVIGGDGTIHEVVNGVGGQHYPISVIPSGTGNDFARGYRIKGAPTEIFKKIVTSKVEKFYWPGTFKVDKNRSQPRLFANSIGFGFDAEIVRVANQSTHKKILSKWRIGTFSYVISLLQVLRHYKPKNLLVTIDGEEREIKNVWMLTIANHSYYGGGMKIIPDAKVEPKRIPILIVQDVSRWKVLGLFFTVFLGKHVLLKEVSVCHGTEVVVVSETPISFQADGEVDSCTRCSISKLDTPHKIIGTNF